MSQAESHAERECPVCQKDRLCSPQEARAVYRTKNWGSEAMLDDADRVCAYCFAARINGTWTRMKTVGSRAYELSKAGSKDKSHYRDVLTSGIEPGSGQTGTDRGGGDRAASNPSEKDW